MVRWARGLLSRDSSLSLSLRSRILSWSDDLRRRKLTAVSCSVRDVDAESSVHPATSGSTFVSPAPSDLPPTSTNHLYLRHPRVSPHRYFSLFLYKSFLLLDKCRVLFFPFFFFSEQLRLRRRKQWHISGGTVLGEPLRVEKLGETYLPYSIFLEYINGLGSSKFASGTYNLFKHNCNNFSEEVSSFLVGQGIPKYILDLPEEILRTPLGQQLAPLINSLTSGASAGFTVGQRFVEARIQREASPEYQLLNTAIEEARLNSIALEERRNVLNEKLAKKERKKKKKKKEKREKSNRGSGSESNSTGTSNYCLEMAEEGTMSEMQPSNGDLGAEMLPSERVMQMEAEEKLQLEEKKRQRDPPIVFKNVLDASAEFDALARLLEGKLNDTEITNLDELRQYVLENEGSWALGDNFLNFVGRILYDKSLDSEARVKLLNVLSVAALKDDVILLLHQDRREHTIMNFAFDIDRQPAEEQLPLAQFMANMFENLSSSEWLLYISEWQHLNQGISNIRVTTKVAVHSLLSESPELQARGAAIIHNLACKEVFDDVAVELTMALLQFFNGSPAEEQLYACMKALSRFTQISGQEVPQLVQMIGPEPNKFRGTSPRIDELIDQINKKLR